MLNDETQVYNINKEYRIVRVKGKKCSLFFKNRQNQLLATLEGCQNEFTEIQIPAERNLTSLEKGYLLSFIRAKKHSISKDVASKLDVSIVNYLDGREEYLSERQLKRRISKGIDFAKVYVGKLIAYSVKIPADSKDCSYNFSKAEVVKIMVDENCNINIDLRDNLYVESLVVGERFTGNINLSRSSIESAFFANNCKCNLTIADAKKCFNLQIADIYSGNLNIDNCCLYALGVGYYSYAEIMLANNLIKKEISIGDSFRGGFYAINQNVDLMKIGDDCKGKLKIGSQGRNMGIKKIIIDDDFAGDLNLSGDETLQCLEIGRKYGGKIDVSHTTSLDKIKIGKFYNGNMNLTNSSIQNLSIEYGGSGSLNLNDCHDLKYVQATIDNNIFIDSNLSIHNIRTIENEVYYDYAIDAKYIQYMPFYKRIYQNIYNRFM
jgi:hypothetical protein